MASKYVKWLLGIFGVPVLAFSAPFTYFNPTDTAAVPKLLSQTGVYNNTVTKQIDTAMKPFEVNAALWSDDAHKSRWIILKPGKHITYDDTTDFFNYPDSTVFVKTFALERTEGDTNSRVYWETRLLVKKKDSASSFSPKDWFGFSYKWNAAGTDANLISIDFGFDTVFYFTPKGRTTQSYKKWHFPSQSDCSRCHRVDYGDSGKLIGRSVLGFYPAQLKKANTPINGTNQITYLFRPNVGVFIGTQPNAAALARRFRGMKEAIPGGLTAAQRWSIIDTMARSYLASNCAGCHGDRGIRAGATGQGCDINFDWYNFTARQEVGMHGYSVFGLNDTATGDSLYDPSGRQKYILMVKQVGLATGLGQIWDMSLPAVDPFTLQPAVIYPGYPALSYGLFRQASRNAAWNDSGVTWRSLTTRASYVPPDTQAVNWLTWIFTQPWGSLAWRNLIQSKGLTVNDVMNTQNYTFFGTDQNQMPPLATFTADTSALKILGEWAKYYRGGPGITGIHGKRPGKGDLRSANGPSVRNHVLFIPREWQGETEVMMLDIKGKVTSLKALGKGSYEIPKTSPSGLYFFKVGSHYFKISVF